MKSKLSMVFIICVSVLATVSVGLAVVEWDIQKNLTLKHAPRDLAVSRNGKWIYILTDAGEISIYSSDGILQDTLGVGSQIDRIQEGPSEDVLFVSNRADNRVQILSLEFVQEINTAGAPVRGDANAPVSIAVFAEFQ